MSKFQHTDAELVGYGKPIFPESLDLLRQIQRECDIKTWYLLDLAAQELESFLCSNRPTTTDGYTWFCGLHFLSNNGCVCLLFPWHQDFDSPDGDKSDRSIAIYVRGDGDLNQVISLFMQAMINLRKQATMWPITSEIQELEQQMLAFKK